MIVDSTFWVTLALAVPLGVGSNFATSYLRRVPRWRLAAKIADREKFLRYAEFELKTTGGSSDILLTTILGLFRRLGPVLFLAGICLGMKVATDFDPKKLGLEALIFLFALFSAYNGLVIWFEARLVDTLADAVRNTQKVRDEIAELKARAARGGSGIDPQ